jgi:hypothetical protein
MNSNAKTPISQWRWIETNKNLFTLIDANNEIVATDFYACTPADLDLIAAAPDMLEALEALVDFVNSIDTIRQMDQKGFLPTCIVNSKLAINKAKGEQP